MNLTETIVQPKQNGNKQSSLELSNEILGELQMFTSSFWLERVGGPHELTPKSTPTHLPLPYLKRLRLHF